MSRKNTANGYLPDFGEELVQLSKLALTARRQDVESFLRRIVKKRSSDSPDLTTQLTAIMAMGVTRRSPLRGASTSALPVDKDSRLHLIRVEQPEEIDVVPLLSVDVMAQLESVLLERRSVDVLLKSGVSPTKSLLFTGPPGVGKTLCAKWIAKELNIPLLTLDLSAVMSSYLGRTGTNVRVVLDYAKNEQCVLFLDEFDAIAKRRDDGSEVGELKRLVTVLLQEIDDWPETGMLLAATNHGNLLDPAIWRRFDEVVEIPLPANEQLESYATNALKDVGMRKKNIRLLARAFIGASLSDLERTLNGIRRAVALGSEKESQLVINAIGKRCRHLSDENRIRLATMMRDSGMTERQTEEATGLTRKTVRKHHKGKSIKEKSTK